MNWSRGCGFQGAAAALFTIHVSCSTIGTINMIMVNHFGLSSISKRFTTQCKR